MKINGQRSIVHGLSSIVLQCTFPPPKAGSEPRHDFQNLPMTAVTGGVNKS
ncbi:MAG: hypothetical protein HND47_23045 [Chloroflexi bacterium]|nr:hypothetical protein [Chloroflexota bacterium]